MGGVARIGLVEAVEVAEVLVEVLLGGKHRAPGRLAAGAVVERAAHGGSGGVLARHQPGVASRRPGDGHRGLAGEATVILRAARVAPGAVGGAHDLYHREAVSSNADIHLVAGGVLRVVAREHQLLVGVLVVHRQQAAVRGARAEGQRQEPYEVAVVAELLGLGGGGLLPDIVNRRLGGERLAPADERAGVVALGHLHLVVGDCSRRNRGELGRSNALGLGLLCVHGGRADDRHRGGDGGALQHVTAAQTALHDLLKRIAGTFIRAYYPLVLLVVTTHPEDSLSSICGAQAHSDKPRLAPGACQR